MNTNNATEKQIAYAEKILNDRIAFINAAAAGKPEVRGWWKTSHESGATPELDASAVIEMLNNMGAIEIIETKGIHTADLYAKHIGFKFPVWVDNPDCDDPFGFEPAGEWVY